MPRAVECHLHSGQGQVQKRAPPIVAVPGVLVSGTLCSMTVTSGRRGSGPRTQCDTRIGTVATVCPRQASLTCFCSHSRYGLAASSLFGTTCECRMDGGEGARETEVQKRPDDGKKMHLHTTDPTHRVPSCACACAKASSSSRDQGAFLRTRQLALSTSVILRRQGSQERRFQVKVEAPRTYISAATRCYTLA